MHWPQITMIVLAAIAGTVALLQHGKPKEYNFWHWSSAAAIEFALMYAGGFFG